MMRPTAAKSRIMHPAAASTLLHQIGDSWCFRQGLPAMHIVDGLPKARQLELCPQLRIFAANNVFSGIFLGGVVEEGKEGCQRQITTTFQNDKRR